MTEYIEKEKAIQEIIDVYEHEFPTASGEFDRFVSVIVPQILKNMPASDVEPVRHGRWINEKCKIKGIFAEYCYDCSVCGTPTGYDRFPISSYCPNCGAKMDKEEEQLEWERTASGVKEVPSDGR